MDTTHANREDLERDQDVTLEALGDTLALHDAPTQHHSMRVTLFAIALARAMGLPKDQSRVLAQGALLHDIGKIAITPAILRKAGALTPEESKIVHEHCGHGHHMLRKIPFLGDAAEIVYAHHENWDGTGYPRNLMENEIPLGARIVAIVNALDAMTSNQPYRQALAPSAARKEIVRWSGRQFDPDVVKVFLSVPESVWYSLRNQIV